MQLSNDLMRLALDDVRARHAASVSLIYFGETQSMGILRLSVSLCTATASAAAVGFAGAVSIPHPAAWALAIAAAAFFLGSAFALASMKSARINLPGRHPEFWEWAMEPAVTGDQMLRGYLQNLAEKSELNARTNRASARLLRVAKVLLLAAPIAGAVAAAMALRLAH